jgi:DNA-binding transcriptional MocR family regulator
MKATTGFSITTINQAYLELESEGIIQARPRSGFFLRKIIRKAPKVKINHPVEPDCRPVNRSSMIQSCMETVGDPRLIPLGLALPHESLLPVKRLGMVAAKVMRYQAAKGMAYESVQGNRDLRSKIAFRSLDTGVLFDPEQLIITSGTLEAITLALRTVTKPNDTVLIAEPCYFAFLQILESLGLRAVSVRSCPDKGIVLNDVKQVLQKFNIAACLLSPNFANPDASLMPSEAKQELVDLLTQKEIPIIEDDVYTEIYFTENRPEPLKAHDKEGLVLLCSSFSKTLAPGYRVGWLEPGRFKEEALKHKAGTNPHSATPNQMIVAEYLAQGDFDQHLKRLRKSAHAQVEAIQQRISQVFPSNTCCSRPLGGMFLWLKLPPEIDARTLFLKTHAKGVAIIPGNVFSCHQGGLKEFIRIGCGHPLTPKIEKGIHILGELLREMTKKGSNSCKGLCTRKLA